MKRLAIILIFISLKSFSQEQAAKTRFPIRLKSIQLHLAQYNSGIDIINMFSHHLILKPESFSNYLWSLDIRIMSFLDIIFSRESYTLKIPQSSKYSFDEYEFDYEKYQYGFRLHFYNIALELGTGQRQFHTFLETDTNYYFHRQVDSSYTFINLNYTYPTSLSFDMNVFYEQLFFTRSQTEDIVLDEGDQKNFGVRLLFGSRYQVAPFFSHSYTNIKLIHKFFGLNNEMNNKFFEEKLGVSLIYNY